ncbi:MAG: porin family protein [Bacteroidaceae bacterium]|nr:porin family protein [Bacteroidaceae bacterium]
MKKISVILLVLGMFIAAPAAAQLNWGIKAGVNMPEAPKNIKGIIDGHTGWYAGPMAKFIAPVLGLGVEAGVLYSESGVAINEETYKKSSIEIPLYLRYELRLPAIKNFLTPFIAVGPQWGYTFGKKEFGQRLKDVNEFSDVKDISDKYFKYDESCFSLNLGLGFILFNHLQLHANYNIALGQNYEYRGLENINLLNGLETIKSKNNMWQISLAYIF